MCIKYPFLYPRNVWTGKHWQSWKIHNYLYGKPARREFKNGKFIDIPAVPGIQSKAFEFTLYDEHFKTKKIIKSVFWFIWFYIVYFIGEYFLPIFHCIPTYTWWDSVPKGWKKAFGKEYLNELKKVLKETNYLYKFRITDVKEKYNTLRVYCISAPKEVYDVISKYENLAREYCIVCGKPATTISSGYMLSYCNEHYDKRFIPMEIKNKDNNWEYTKEFKDLDA